MKNSILKLAIILLFINCKAQTPIIDRYGSQGHQDMNGAYYKDINGFHNQYVGTWLYTNGTNSLKITFQKRDFKFVESYINYYEDFLVGEYQYIENGIEKVNTLNNLNIDYGNDIDKYNLNSVYKIKYARNDCPECGPNESRLGMFLNEPSRYNIDGLSNEFRIRAYTENGIQKLKVWFTFTGMETLIKDRITGLPSNVTNYSIPYGEYVLIKQ